MIVAQAEPITAQITTTLELDNFDRFGEDFPDGRLVEPSSAKPFKLREAIALSKKLGRPLTEEEMKQFEITD